MLKKWFGLLILVSLILTLVPAAFAAPPLQEEGKVYTIQKDDWLSKLADKEYGDVLAYSAIVYYTNQAADTDSDITQISDPNRLEVGDAIMLPTADQVAAYLDGERVEPVQSDTAPDDAWGVVTVGPGEPVRLGFAAALSGAGLDVLGIDEMRGAELAVADHPEILGHTLELVIEDSMCSGEGGTAVANKFVADPTIVGVVGHMCTHASIPGSDIYEKAGYTMISPSATAAVFTARGLKSANRVCWNDNVQGPAAAQFIYDVLGARKMAALHDGSTYGEALAKETARVFAELGGTVVAEEAISVGDTDMRPVLAKIGVAEPDIIYFGGFPAEAGYLATQRFDVGLDDVIFMGSDGIKAQDYIDAAGDAAEGTYASAAAPANLPLLNSFLAKYEVTYGEEPPAPFHAHAYDAANVFIEAIYEVAVQGPDGTLWIGRQALNDAVRATSGYQGVTGIITCDDVGDCSTGTVAVSTVVDGKFVFAE